MLFTTRINSKVRHKILKILKKSHKWLNSCLGVLLAKAIYWMYPSQRRSDCNKQALYSIPLRLRRMNETYQLVRCHFAKSKGRDWGDENFLQHDFNFIRLLFLYTNFQEQFRIVDCGSRICCIASLYLFLLNWQNTLNQKSKFPNPKFLMNKCWMNC